MAAASPPRTAGSTLRSMAIELLQLLASLKLAVLLIVTLAAVLAWATFLEAAKGREYVQWHVYHSSWFGGLLALLAVNIFASAASRFPWGRKRIGFLITHAGLLVLLAGAIQTFVAGIDGQLAFEEGAAANSISITDRCQFTAAWQASGGAPRRFGSAFIFQPGPTDWPEGKTLDIGELGDVAVQVLKFYRHARVEEDWVEDREGRGAPALKFLLTGPDGQPVREEWLVADRFGSQVSVGPVRFEFQRAPMDSMVEDFLRPPPANADKDGILSMHYEGRMHRIPVSQSVGKKLPVGDTKVLVEIVQYLPNAKPGPGGKFISRGSEPDNPLLELRVYLPGKEQPLRQIAFAKLPLLNLDGIHGWSCPVKFWYHHPAVAPQSGVGFFQTSDGKLHCRVGRDGKYEPRGAVTKGQPIEISEQFKASVSELLPSARRKVTFYPLELAPGEVGGPESAALVEVSAGGTSQQFWMQRNHAEYGVRTIQTPEGLLDFRFGYERLPLGFTLRLERFERGLNPGRMGDASFASLVRLVDPHRGINEDREISMNEPLSHDKFSFYQSSFQELPDGRTASILSVAYDPGRFLKYLGSVLVCLGIFAMFYTRYRFFEAIALWIRRRPRAADHTMEFTMRYSLVAVVASLSLGLPALAETPQDSPIDWTPWRYLPVQDGGRYKPLDTLAWETLRTLCNRASFTDPETGQKLDAVALYLTMLFEWEGRDQVSDAGPSAAFKSSHMRKPDKWDRAGLLRVDYLELRKSLGLAEDQKYLSPLELSQAKIRDPRSGGEAAFLLWAEKIGRQEARGLSTLERKGLELAANYWAYRDLRMGKRLGVMPIQGSTHEPWLTIADLMKSNFDDDDDPTGGIRKAKEQFRQARAAYLAKSPEAFGAAAADFIATLQEFGPELGAYPRQATIDWEVAYNHWVPFRFAWVLTMLAFFCVALSMGTNWKPLYAAGVGMFVLGFLAMLVGFGLRIAISGRAPVTNMYESVVYLSLGTAAFGLIFELIYRSRYVLAAAAAVSTIGLVLADNCPVILDPSLRPLQPVLRSNFWLVTHVMSITLSYAAFALALGVGDITLGYFLVRSQKRELIAALTRFTYKALQVGVLLLAAGTILGAVWADYSWGRFWGWDPKEVWALIALLVYLAVLHARFIGWLHELGLAAWSVLCFDAVVMAWYGVNYGLGAGLHSYGFGGGGQTYVLVALLLQFLYVIAAVLMATAGPKGEAPATSPPQ